MSLGLLSFFVNLGYGIVLPILPTLAAATAFEVGLMFSAFSAMKLVAQLAGGASADRLGAERVLRLGVAGYAVSLAGLASSTSVPAVLAFRALEGLTVGAAVPALSSLVLATSAPAEFTRRHSIVLGIGGAGMVMGPLLGFAVGRPLVRPAMIAIAVAALVAALAVPRIVAAREHASSPVGDRSLANELLGYARSPAFIVLVLPLAFGKLAFGLLQPLLPLHGPRVGLSEFAIAALFGATGVLFVAMQPVAGVLSKRIAARTMTVVFAALAAIAFVVMAVFPGAVGFTLGYLGYVTAGSLLFAANSGVVGERYHEAAGDHGKVFGAMHSVADVAMLAGPPLLLALYEREASSGFLAVAILGALAVTGFVSRVGRSR